MIGCATAEEMPTETCAGLQIQVRLVQVAGEGSPKVNHSLANFLNSSLRLVYWQA